MKKLSLVVAIAGSFIAAHASSITLASSASATGLSVVASTGTDDSSAVIQNLDPNSGWAAALAGSNWISNGKTGNPSDSGYVTYNNNDTVTFEQTFTLSGTITNAVLNVLADDTVGITVNGQVLFAAALGDGNTYSTCSNVEVGCLTTTEGSFNTSNFGALLKDGANTIDFTVYQENGSSFGLDYAGNIQTSTTPEPSSMILMASGLLGLGSKFGRRFVRAS